MTYRSAGITLICFGFLGYFAYHLFVGNLGLEARARLENEVKLLNAELKGLEAVRGRLDRDVALMRADNLDPDMLDERARAVLNFSHPNDIVIMNKRPATGSTR
jgi:cell division protein FtsB